MARTVVFSVGTTVLLTLLVSGFPAVAEAPNPIFANRVPCCNTETGAWYRPPEVLTFLMLPKVCLEVPTGSPAPWGSAEAVACTSPVPDGPGDPPPPPPPSPPLEITTVVEDRQTIEWKITCHRKTWDILALPEDRWTDEALDEFDKLVGEFEAIHGILIRTDRITRTNAKGEPAGNPVDRITTRSTGPLDGKNGGRAICDWLRKHFG